MRTCLVFLLFCLTLSGQTKLYLRDTATSLGGVSPTTSGGIGGCANGTNNYSAKATSTTAGSSTTTEATFAPIATPAPPCLFQTASGSGLYVVWYTPPLSAGLTLQGNVDYKVGLAESAAQLNGGYDVVLYHWKASVGGVVATINDSVTSGEPTTSVTGITIASAALTTTTLAVGDRIMIVPRVQNVGTWGGNSTRTITLTWDAAAGNAREAFVNFSDATADLTFSADSNNARPLLSWRWFVQQLFGVINV